MKKAEHARKRFSKESKQDTVKMIIEKGHSIAEVAKNHEDGLFLTVKP